MSLEALVGTWKRCKARRQIVKGFQEGHLNISAVGPCTVKKIIVECFELISEQQENNICVFLVLGTLRSAI